MDDSIYHETEKILLKVRKTRNRYINEAVKFYNLLQNRKLLAQQLQLESRLVREESMKMLSDFESIED